MSVNSCSMPNSGSCFLYFLAVLTAAARVLVGCGLPSTRYTSVITSTLSPPRIGSGYDGDRLEHAVALVAGGLVRARTVETPDRKFAAVFDDLRLRSKFRRRLGAVDPDVLSLVDHCCPQSFRDSLGADRRDRPSDCVRNRRSDAVAERLLCCERRVNSSTDLFHAAHSPAVASTSMRRRPEPPAPSSTGRRTAIGSLTP